MFFQTLTNFSKILKNLVLSNFLSTNYLFDKGGERISVSEEGRDGGGELNTVDRSLDLDSDP